MLKKTEFFRVGIIRKTHGVKGEMMLLCDAETDFEKIGEWLFFDLDECLIPFKITSLRSATDKTVLFSCTHIDNIEQASAYIDTNIYLPKEKRQHIRNYESPSSLVGLEIINEKDKAIIGTITAYIESPHNPLLEIDHHGQEVLLPFNKEFILGVEEDLLWVNIPDGLLDL